ncbi:hypothetical protein [Paraburkholderia sp. Tr-20389]|uniref:hypothetical protein n=1 Tax=Paraburkholderia sp. Tr-20389 TaxID=2703903 RepID=UPI003216BA27
MCSENLCECACNVACGRPSKPEASVLSDDTILAIARRAGMLVMLDGRIGRETYQSVTGSVSSLHRFVADMYNLILDGTPQ